MPWKPSDAPSHTKKANTPAKRSKWASVANSVRASCIKGGGGVKECDAKAIRVANSKMSEEMKMGDKMNIPKGALNLIDSEAGNPVAEFAEGKSPRLRMTVYSGKLIKNHFWWDDLAIDGKGVSLAKPTFPVLSQHDVDKKIAFSKDPVIGEDGSIRLNSDKTTFVDTEVSREFQKTSKEGFPYEASMYIRPTSIERLEKGAKAEVNGYSMTGPGTIFRKSELKEASVCVFGADSKTSSVAFSESEGEELEIDEVTTGKVKLNRREEVKGMDLKELQEKHPELYKEVREAAITGLKEAQDEEKEAWNTEKAKLEAANAKLQKVNDGNSDRILVLEKDKAIRDKKEEASRLSGKADKIWDAKLEASDIPEDMWDKVRVMKPYTKFVNKDNELDGEAFSKAVDEEIKSWEGMGIKASVLGGGSRKRTTEDEGTQTSEEVKKENEKNTGVLLSFTDQKKAENT